MFFFFLFFFFLGFLNYYFDKVVMSENEARKEDVKNPPKVSC